MVTGSATAEMYCTFVLRALGYSDTNSADFTWSNPFDLAKSISIVTDNVRIQDFWRADIVTVSYNSLFAKLKGSSQTLVNKLITDGVVTETQYKIATCTSKYTILNSGQVPTALQGRKLTDNQVQALVGKDSGTVKNALSTVQDVVAWFNASNFSYMDGACWTNNPNSYYERYESGSDILYSEQNLTYTGKAYNLGVDNVSIAAAWLLQDDFDEAGIISAIVKGKNPNYNAAYLKVDNYYYIIDFAPLITNTSNRVRSTMMSSLKTESLYSLSTIISDTGNSSKFILLGTTSKLDERLNYAKYGSYAEFAQPDFEVLFSSYNNLSLESYVINNDSTSNSINISSFNIPYGLGGTTISLDEAKALVGEDAKTIAAAVHTVADVLLYFHAAKFLFKGGDKQVTDGSVTWHFNDSAITSLMNGYANCGATANTVRYLLDGDYDEIGFIAHTYKTGGGGGHVYNYIKTGDKYYVVDMTEYTNSSYSPDVTAIQELDRLSDYADCYSRMSGYGNYLPVVYAYEAEREIPMAWNNSDTITTWYPTGTEINVICEDTANGYKIDYRTLSPNVLAQIEAARTDVTERSNDMSNFPGIVAYNLPSSLGGVSLTDQQVIELISSGASLDEVADAVKTVGDAMIYLYAAGIISADGDILTSGSQGQEWRCNLFADSAFKQKSANCGATANLVRYLLDGDYDDVGYVCHTYAYGGGGGHIYNYVEVDGDYCIVDLNFYLRSNYSTSSKYAISLGNSLSNYASSFSQMYPNSNIKVIYAYSSPEELPISWSIFDDVYVTYLPEANREDVLIILETGEYSVGFANLSAELWNYINTKR